MGVKQEDKKSQVVKKMVAINFGKIFGLVSSLLKPFYNYIIILTLTAVAQTILIGFRELSVKFIIDKLISYQGMSLALMWVGFLMFGDIAIECSYRLSDRMNYKYRPLLKKHITETLLKKMMNYSYSFYQNKNSTELSACITDVFDGVEDSIIIVFDEFIHFALLVFITSAYALLVSTKISLILMSWGVIWSIAALYWGGKMYMLTYAYSQAQIKLEGNMADLFEHIFTVQSFYNADNEMNNISSWTDRLVHAETVLRKMQFKVWVIQGFSFCLINGLILVYVVYLYSLGMVTAGDVSFIFGLIANLYSALWDLAKEVREFIDAAGKIAQGMHLIGGEEVNANDNGETLIVSKGEIIIDKIHFSYPTKQYDVIHEDQLRLFTGTDHIHIKQGEFVGLVGPSGSGKSTLLKLILRIFEISDGRILIDGQDISKVSLKSLRKSIAVIPQDAGLFMQRSILDNIVYGTYNHVDDQIMAEIIEAAKKTHAHDFIMSLPEQYNTILSEYGINLSGGQKQRIAITRGFVKKASIFLLDEATSALDNITQSSINDYIWDAIKGKTCLIIAHRLGTLRMTNRVLVFDQGRVVQEGKHDELILTEGLYKDLWMAQ